MAINLYVFVKLGATQRYSFVTLDDGDYIIEDGVTKKMIVRLIDKNLDGSVDYLHQIIRDESGNDIRDVIDYDFDGQADFRIEFKDGNGYTWHENAWRRFFYEKDTKQWHIKLDGKKVLLTKDNSLMVKWHGQLFGKR